LLRGKRIAGAQTVPSSDQAHYSGLHLFTRFAGKSCAYLHAALDTLLEDHFANRPGQKA
jgi:hypothetical protein